jgi:hypothetical protein
MTDKSKIWRPKDLNPSEFLSMFLDYEPEIFDRFINSEDKKKFQQIFETVKSESLIGHFHEIDISKRNIIYLLFTNLPNFEAQITPF